MEDRYYTALLRGNKTCEGRKRGTEEHPTKFKDLHAGQLIRMRNTSNNRSVLMRVTRIHCYFKIPQIPTHPLVRFLEAEGVSNVLPGVSDLNQAISIYLSFGMTMEEIEKTGFMAIYLQQFDDERDDVDPPMEE